MTRKRAAGSAGRRAAGARDALIAAVGAAVAGFQDESADFDTVAARVLAVERGDLPCMTLLLFGGPSSADRLSAALHAPSSAVVATIDRLQRAGYARARPGPGPAEIELTDHAREWIERIWAPLREQGVRLLARRSTRELQSMHAFMAAARAVQRRQARRLRQWLERPRDSARRPHLRGGLSPAALRRVQVFVEANLDRPIRLADLAWRAGLSPFHFARAFRTSTGSTPRAFVERRRVDRARQLIEASPLTLAQIALECGLGSQSRLTTTFRRLTGFTPGEYRRTRATST